MYSITIQSVYEDILINVDLVSDIGDDLRKSNSIYDILLLDVNDSNSKFIIALSEFELDHKCILEELDIL